MLPKNICCSQSMSVKTLKYTLLKKDIRCPISVTTTFSQIRSSSRVIGMVFPGHD